ncbi:hypothetical protein ACJIZ3_019231 [Penstemon smallii]|uniref:DUF674 family protein n=1 Tax=Penstemon smallii TaxID=265156 RepID=A0ABD3T0K8_9LAMI
MFTSEEVRFSLTVITNKEKTKVLFAIIDNNLADILLSFLTLPLGVIQQLLEKHYGDQAPTIGSLNTFHRGLANLDSDHFWKEACKLMLFNPRSSFEEECFRLKLNIYDNQSAIYFACESKDCRSTSVSLYHDTERCSCWKSMNREICINGKQSHYSGGGFTVENKSFLISDNLQMLPNDTGSMIKLVKDMGINETEQMTVSIGYNEIMDLLKGSLLSQTPLTDLILRRRLMRKSTLPLGIERREISCSKKMKVKAIIQRSTNKFLYVEAEEDFIEYMFSFLTIPLGKVEFLLDSKTSLGSIDNLYSSLPNLKYIKTPHTLERLLNPELPPKYLSTNQIFPLTEQKTPVIYYDYPNANDKNMKFSKSYLLYKKPEAHIMDPKGYHTYMKGPRLFTITDDLTVTPFCILSTLSTLKRLKIPLSDVEVMELHIGLEEGLSILKASLNSTSALINGLNHILKKQPKQEHSK